MTKTPTKEMMSKMRREKHVGVFPFEFTETKVEDSEVKIPDTIHIIPIGQWEHDMYGPILITSADINEFVANFDSKIRKGVFITAGHEGFEELPANGWFTSVEARADGLWGTVEWNNLGKATLSDKQFKYFSPEFYRDYEDPETHTIYRNVLTGGALTKSPYFKELQAVVFSEPKLKSQFNDNNNHMNLADILAKDITTLSDEEKAFIKEHAAELTDEQKASHTAIIDEAETDEEKTAREAKEAQNKLDQEEKEKGDANEAAGLNRDGSVKASEKHGKMITLSETEVTLLRQKANEGAQAFKELADQKLATSVKGLIFSEGNKTGKFLPKSEVALKTFMATLNESQRLAFSGIVAQLPTSTVFKEIGGAADTEGSAQKEVETKVELKMKENVKMTYAEALKAVMSENVDNKLEDRYDAELKPEKK